MFRKIAVWVLIGIMGVCFLGNMSVVSYEIDTSAPYGEPSQSWEGAVDFGKIIKTEAIDPTDSASEKIQKAYKINLDDDQRATAYIKNVMNWILAIIWLVALTTLIYGFYRMVLTTDNEEWYKNARKIIFIALVALVIVGMAWIIVSQFFDIFFQVKKEINV